MQKYGNSKPEPDARLPGHSTASAVSSTLASSAGMASLATTSPVVQEAESALQDAMVRAETAEDRILRAMAQFSKVTPLASQIPAQRGGSALIASVEARNELNESSLWDDFMSSSPVQFLKAELKTPTQTCILERTLGRFEVVVPLIGGSLNMKLLPDLIISKVQREDLDCQEGDRIVSVDGNPVSAIEDLRIYLKGKSEITLIIQNGGTPLFTIHDASTPFWEVTTIPTATTVRGSLKPGDLVLRINDMAVAGLDTRNALDSQYAKVSLLPAGSQLAQRIKSEGLMSFTTQVEVSMAKDMTSPDPKYDIILSNFDPAMFAGAYIVGVFLGRYQVGEEFALEIVEGPADAKRSDLVHDGAWTAVAGQPLDFKLVCRDSAGNAKFKGGDKVWIADATVRDLGNGQYAVSWSNTLVGLKAMNITVNGEPMQVGTPHVDVTPSEVHLPGCLVSLTAGGTSLETANPDVDWSVVAGTNASLKVRLVDQYGNHRPRGKDRVSIILHSPSFHQVQTEADVLLQPSALGVYELAGLVTVATPKDADMNLSKAKISVLINGNMLGSHPWTLDVVPAAVSLPNCHATVTPAGIKAAAGDRFEFEVLVRDQFNNPCNHSEDTIELYETSAITRGRVEEWADYQVTATGHGAYRISAAMTQARSSRFSFAVNGVGSTFEQHLYTLTIVPNEISIPHCVVTGELATTVGQYVALLIALRDRYGNVCTEQQTAGKALAVTQIEKVSGYTNAKELVLVSRISQVEFYPGIIYTHQVVITTEQAVVASLNLELDGQLLHETTLTFTPDGLHPDACLVDGVPPSVVAGEPFSLGITLRDSFRNGLDGLESHISLTIMDGSSTLSVACSKVKGTEQGNGKYNVTFKIFTANPLSQFRLQVKDRSILVASLEVLPARATAKTSEVTSLEECRVHFPYIISGILRDEFGNLAPSDKSPVTIEVDGCALAGTDARIFLERSGTFNIVFVPKRNGDARFQVLVNGEQLCDKTAIVRGLSSWTKQDASEWVQTIAHYDPALKAMAKSLSEEFVAQTVTGAKIAGGLLDKGALHFAFKITDMKSAEFFAMVISDLNKGPDAPSSYLPWAWSSLGSPSKLQQIDISDPAHIQLTERLRVSMPDATVVSISRNEDAEAYTTYFEVRQTIGLMRGGNPNERYFWYCGDQSVIPDLIENGFEKSILPKCADHMVLGHGFMFSPDPRLADFISTKGQAKPGERKLVLARVACGGIASRDTLPQNNKLAENVERPDNRLPPSGFQSSTSHQRTELVTYYDQSAYPEYVVTYTLPYANTVAWPETSARSANGATDNLLKLEDVRQDI